MIMIFSTFDNLKILFVNARDNFMITLLNRSLPMIRNREESGLLQCLKHEKRNRNTI